MAVSLQGVSGATAEAFTGVVQIMGQVVGVAVNPRHGIGKQPCSAIHLMAGLGVVGDAHFGTLVQHRWLRKKDPTLPNRTQVHLMHAELFAELASAGMIVTAGGLGENITTDGIDLLELPLGARLSLGAEAVIEITGLREPCSQLNRVHPGLIKLLRYRDRGAIVRKAGVMGIVVHGGEVRAGDNILASMPSQPWTALGPV